MEPIVVEFEVDCPVEHAFKMWTEKAALWWPRSHTISGDSDLSVVFEPNVGGRIYEVGSDGGEHEWGEVTVWNPPDHIEYLWHLFFDRSQATHLTVTFGEVSGGTRVRLVQTGFERLPEEIALTRRNRTEGAWAEVTGFFRDALASE